MFINMNHKIIFLWEWIIITISLILITIIWLDISYHKIQKYSLYKPFLIFYNIYSAIYIHLDYYIYLHTWSTQEGRVEIKLTPIFQYFNISHLTHNCNRISLTFLSPHPIRQLITTRLSHLILNTLSTYCGSAVQCRSATQYKHFLSVCMSMEK